LLLLLLLKQPLLHATHAGPRRCNTAALISSFACSSYFQAIALEFLLTLLLLLLLPACLACVLQGLGQAV
jgi:hypothetical protein